MFLTSSLYAGNADQSKIHWVGWDSVTRPKKYGGLGLVKFNVSNNALLLKWFWRYRKEGQALWTKVIEAIHGSKRRWLSVPHNKNVRGVWGKIVNCGNRLIVNGSAFSSLLQGRVGNGNDIRFWIDSWIGQAPLKSLFPALFRIEQNKWCVVSDRVNHNGRSGIMAWDWKRYPETDLEIAELIECSRLTANTVIHPFADSWEWNNTSLQFLSVQDTKKWYLNADLSDLNVEDNWVKWLPAKCNLFIWRAGLNRIPTVEALRKRNIQVDYAGCVLCAGSEETVDHLVAECQFSNGVWSGIARWCRIPPIFLFSAKDIHVVAEHSGYSKSKKDIIHGILVITLWRIWKARNEKVFRDTNVSIVQVIADVKGLSFLWFTSRHKGPEVSWEGWRLFDFNVT